MIEQVVFARGAWWPRHRPSLDCWCHPTPYGEDARLALHRAIAAPSLRQRSFISGRIEAPV